MRRVLGQVKIVGNILVVAGIDAGGVGLEAVVADGGAHEQGRIGEVAHPREGKRCGAGVKEGQKAKRLGVVGLAEGVLK